jgi:hypothetical protein
MKTLSKQQGQGMQVIPTNGHRCVWMKAGAVNCKTCESPFDCTSCAFDKEISRKLAQKPTAPASWREVMRQLHLRKECRHMLTGRVIFKLCSHNYECQDCAYDQLLDEYDQLPRAADRPVLAAAPVNAAAGFMVSDACYATN